MWEFSDSSQLMRTFTYRPEDSEYEVANMKPGVGKLDVFPSIWGHWAGGPPGNMEDVKYFDNALANWLE